MGISTSLWELTEGSREVHQRPWKLVGLSCWRWDLYVGLHAGWAFLGWRLAGFTVVSRWSIRVGMRSI